MEPASCTPITAVGARSGELASGVRAGAGAAGIGIRGSQLIHSCRWEGSSTAHLAGDSILRVWSSAHRSSLDTSITRLTRPMLAHGDRVRTTQPAALTHTAFTPERVRRVELSTRGRRLLREACGEALVEADSTVVVSMAVVEAATPADA
jgi:hypothetical protein